MVDPSCVKMFWLNWLLSWCLTQIKQKKIVYKWSIFQSFLVFFTHKEANFQLFVYNFMWQRPQICNYFDVIGCHLGPPLPNQKNTKLNTNGWVPKCPNFKSQLFNLYFRTFNLPNLMLNPQIFNARFITKCSFMATFWVVIIHHKLLISRNFNKNYAKIINNIFVQKLEEKPKFATKVYDYILVTSNNLWLKFLNCVWQVTNDN